MAENEDAEKEKKKEAEIVKRIERNFPRFDEDVVAEENVSRLQRFLVEKDTDLAEALAVELRRIDTPYTNDEVKKLFDHFRDESVRKFRYGRGFVYRDIKGNPLNATSVEIQAIRLAAADERVRLLEELRKKDLNFLASVIEEFQQLGLATTEQTNEILSAVNTQCDKMAEKNIELSLLLEGYEKKEGPSYCVEVTREMVGYVTDIQNENAELRRQLSETAITRQEIELTQDLNEQLLLREAPEVVTQLRAELFELRKENAEKADLNEELERRWEASKAQIEKVKPDVEASRTLKRQVDTQAIVIKRQKASIDDLNVQIKMEKLAQLRLIETTAARITKAEEEFQSRLRQYADKADEIIADLEYDTSIETRRADSALLKHALLKKKYAKLRASKEQYDKFAVRSTRLVAEVKKLKEEKKTWDGVLALEKDKCQRAAGELTALKDQPVYRLDPATGDAVQTDATLASYMDAGREYRILDLDSLNTAGTYGEGHVMSLQDDALRASLLRRLPLNATGQYRVRLSFSDTGGARLLELLVAGLDPVVLSQNSAPRLVVTPPRSTSVEYVSPGAPGNRAIWKDGRLTVTRYSGETRVGEARHYRYRLVGGTVCVVSFDDGTLLYASHLAGETYALDLLVTALY